MLGLDGPFLSKVILQNTKSLKLYELRRQRCYALWSDRDGTSNSTATMDQTANGKEQTVKAKEETMKEKVGAAKEKEGTAKAKVGVANEKDGAVKAKVGVAKEKGGTAKEYTFVWTFDEVKLLLKSCKTF